jgi:FSR family fosmidomycin resistance protein-like MFS transporter
MIKNLSGKKTGTGMSDFMFGGDLARTVGPMVITAAISIWGLEGSYRVMPFGIAASAVLYFKLRNIKPIHKDAAHREGEGIWQTLRELLPFFVAIGGFLLMRAAMKSALTFYLPTFLTGKGNSLWVANASLSVLQLAGALGTFSAGHISDRISHKKVLMITGILSPLAMLLFISASELLVFPLLFLLGLLLFASGPVMLALVQETNTKRPAFVNSIYMFISFGISSAMVLFVGVLGDHYGLEITYKISAGIAFFSVPFLFLLPGKKPKNEI